MIQIIQQIVFMPQLPEVQRTRKFIENFVMNPVPKTIKKVTIYNSSIIKDIEPQTFIKTIQGRYGKFLFLKLQTHSIISHLRLQGKYRFRKKHLEHKKHEHIHFQMTDGSLMAYCDVIRLGSMHLVNRGQEMSHKSIDKMGPQVHKPQFCNDYLLNVCKKRKTTIKQLLLNQDIVSGIGNKWADEILFQSQIHPQTECRKLTFPEIEQIVNASKKKINMALNTSRRFTKLNAYSKTGRPCCRCKTKIEKIRVGDRGAHFCPQCQIKK